MRIDEVMGVERTEAPPDEEWSQTAKDLNLIADEYGKFDMNVVIGEPAGDGIGQGGYRSGVNRIASAQSSFEPYFGEWLLFDSRLTWREEARGKSYLERMEKARDIFGEGRLDAALLPIRMTSGGPAIGDTIALIDRIEEIEKNLDLYLEITPAQGAARPPLPNDFPDDFYEEIKGIAVSFKEFGEPAGLSASTVRRWRDAAQDSNLRRHYRSVYSGDGDRLRDALFKYDAHSIESLQSVRETHRIKDFLKVVHHALRAKVGA